MAAKGLADETALKTAYGYLIEQASKGTEYAKATTRELKLLLNQAGEASEKNLQNMLEWAKTMPEHFDRLGGDSLKYLKERWAKYTKNGTAEKIEQGLKEAAEKLPEGEELGLDGVKAVVEEVGNRINVIKELQQFAENNNVKNLPISYEDIFEMCGRRQDLAENLLKAIPECYGNEGLTLLDLAKKYHLTDSPLEESLSLYQTRIWYKWQESLIKNKLDYTQPLEDVARQAFELRNLLRTQARKSMSDTKWSQYLFENELNRTFEELVNINVARGYSGDALWNKIIQSSMTSRDSVNILFNLD